MALADRLRERIRRDGPMRFDDWMEACLYDPDEGYYMRPGRKTGVGGDAQGGPGDFATNPVLHPFFAAAVAEEIVAAWRSCGQPDAFTVAEYGGGEGDLARDALRWLDDEAPELAEHIEWLHIERSPVHREAQRGDDARIQAAQDLPESMTGFVLAHEFVDALPFHWLEWRKGNWAEVHVGLRDERFVEVLGWAGRFAVEAAPKRELVEGQRVVAMAAARTWLEQVSEHLHRGVVLIADYGDQGRHLWTPERRDGTVRAFQAHRLMDHVLATAPGTSDITASVDFTQLQQWATFEGFDDLGMESQEAFLVRHGALEALAAAPRGTIEEASAYLRLKQMVLPQGMGAVFKVQRFARRLEGER